MKSSAPPVRQGMHKRELEPRLKLQLMGSNWAIVARTGVAAIWTPHCAGRLRRAAPKHSAARASILGHSRAIGWPVETQVAADGAATQREGGTKPFPESHNTFLKQKGR